MNLNNQLYQHEEFECTFLGEKEPFLLISTGVRYDLEITVSGDL